MIPQQLTLKNFLSYQETTLDFRGLHTACVCGSNGAGKSSLLEAISWAIWGESRAASEDDVIHVGSVEAQVEFIFSIHQQTYRVMRSRQRSQGVSLEFQMLQGNTWRSLTAKGVRATQQLILHHLKLDYDTFVNSAYLRQGRADEFMLKRPAERKQILADLLKLNQYDELSEQAKDKSRQYKGQVELLERNLAAIAEQLQQKEAIAQERAELEAVLQHMQAQQAATTEQLQKLQANQHQRQHWQQQLSWQQQQQRNLNQDCQRLQREFQQAEQQRQSLEKILQQERAIAAGYQHWQALQSQEEMLSAKFQAHQVAQVQRQQYQQKQSERTHQLESQLQQLQAQEITLQEQLQEMQKILSKEADVETGMEQLRQARQALTKLDQLQLQAAPLLQRRQNLQRQLDRASTRMSTRIEELRASVRQLQTQQQRQPSLQKAAIAVAVKIEELENLRNYQDQVREKGLERRSFMEQLQAHQRSYEAQLAEIDQIIRLLQQEMMISTETETETEINGESRTSVKLKNQEFPPCPLCNRPLDEHHWNVVLEKHQQQKQDILSEIWVIREQLTTSEREIKVLRQEYTEIEKKLAQYGGTLERRGQLQEQLQTTADIEKKIAQINTEATQLETRLKSGEFERDLHEELRILDQSLQQISYDEKDHALARGSVDRWRWAEIRQAEIKQAKRRQSQLAARQPKLSEQIEQIEQQIEQNNQALVEGLRNCDRQIAEIGYNLEQHNSVRSALRQAQPWQLRYQEFCQAQQHYPQIQQRLQELTHTLQVRYQDLQTATHYCQELIQALEQTPDLTDHIQAIEHQIQRQRQQLDEHLAHLGRLQQQQQHLDSLSTQHSALSTDLKTSRQQCRIYQELAQAFGKNGIQALMIENVLPQLEATTNQILARLSANQLQVQFVTQRNRKTKTPSAKSMETLDILISDARGTRPYETYSGGEAFRVNFAIRLALARLLSQRSGTALQMLIVDEGFGTQDQEGCDRLIAAINAIAPEFACILTITHMPHFREAFQARIEVTKTQEGSKLMLCL